MTTFVTGGSGVVGGAVIRLLVEEGREVLALSRSDASDRSLVALGAVPVRGDVLDIASLRNALDGVEVVYHIAGVNSFCVVDPTPMMRANIDGSRTVVHACRDTGVRRLVYTSSAAAIGESRGTVGRETSPHRGRYISNYEKSKHLAELAVLGDAGPLDVVVVSPSSVQGPGRATGTGRIILDLARGKLPVLVRTRLSMVDIDDCARGHLLAELNGVGGERYVLNGFTVEIEEAVALLGDALGREITVRYLPGAVAMTGAVAASLVGRVRRKKPPVCPEMVRTMLHGHDYDGARATRDLGLEYTPVAETLNRLVSWYRTEGLIEA